MADGTSAPQSGGQTETGQEAQEEEYLSDSGSGPLKLKTKKELSLRDYEKCDSNMQRSSLSMFSI